MVEQKFSLVTNADELDHPHCRLLLEHWTAIKGDAKAPPFLDVLNVPAILPFASIASASADGTDWTISYFGGALAKFHGSDLTGETVNASLPLFADQVMTASLAWENNKPSRLWPTEMPNFRGETKIVEMLCAPLSLNGTDVSEVIQAFGIEE